jgi:perosamine synthetase
MDFFDTHITPRAIELASETLASGWVSEGLRVRQFEEALTGQLGLAHAVAVNSGTSALHLALAVAGVGHGDEVILPPQTFVATGLAILMQGATPVFADVDPLTGNLSPASLREKITERTKAVMPVHWAGYPCDLDEINGIANEHGLTVIEDAAHALGATYRGKPVGAVSRFACFSFQAIKHLTTGDGGALCCLNEEDERQARSRRWFGIDRVRSLPSHLGERVFDITEVGYKYHMNDLAAAVGLGNLEDFQSQLARRQEIGQFYRQQLCHVPGLTLPAIGDDRTHAYWLFPVLVERRDDFIRKLASDGIPASVVHLRIDRYSVFGGARKGLVGQDRFDGTQANLPVHGGMSEEEVRLVVRSVREGW